MKQKILWLPLYRDLHEMIERRYNIISRLSKESGCTLILFNGTHFEHNMFEELLRFFVDGKAGLEDVFARIRSHYNRVIRSLDQDSDDLKALINEGLTQVEYLIHKKVSQPEVCVRDQLQSIQLIIGSKIAYAMLDLENWTWMDARELFRIGSDENRIKPLTDEIQTALKEIFDENKCDLLPVITQSGIIGTPQDNSLVFKLESEIMDAAKMENIEVVRI
jgi:hypothetical protein